MDKVKRGQGGFLLIEALFAIAVLTTFILIFGYYVAGISCGQQESLRRFEAIAQLGNRFERAFAQNDTSIISEGDDSISMSSMLIEVPLFDAIASTSHKPVQFNLIKGTIDWESVNGVKRHVALYGGVYTYE